MNIKKIEFISFGQLMNQQITLSDGVNIIYGKNESGKSTIVEGIISLFYGIYPTSKEKNPFVNWDHHQLSIKGAITQGDKTYEVSRELMSQPTGAIKINGEITQVNNSTLEFLRKIPMALYKDLYCLDTRMIDQLQRETWEKIDSQMIFSYEKIGINNPDDVLSLIDEELNQIWRKSNRGNFRLKTIEQELNDLREEKSELVNIYKHTKDDIDEIDALKVSIKNQQEKLNTREAEQRTIKKLMPIANICIEKKRLESDYTNEEIYKTLSKDIINERKILMEQKKNIKEEILSLEEDIEKANLRKSNLSELEQAIMKNREVIAKKIVVLKNLMSQKNTLKDLKSKEQLIVEEYNQLFYKLFNKICTKDDFEKIKNTSIADIKDNPKGYKMLLSFFLLTTAGGIAYYIHQVLLSVILLSIGIASLIVFMIRKNDSKDLKGFTIASESLETFKRLKEKEYQLLNIIKEKNDIDASVLEKEKVLKSFFSIYHPSENLQVLDSYFDSIFQTIQKKKDENNNIEFLVKEFMIGLDRKKRLLKDYEDQFNKMNQSFIKLSESSIEKGIEIFKKNQKIEAQLKHLDEKIEAMPNGQLLLKEYRDFKGEITTEKLDLVTIEIEKLNQSITDHKIALVKLEEKVEKITITEDIQSITTEIDLLLLEKEELINRKNQLLAMKKIIQKSNESFKEDYQPNIIKEANEYFNAFTHSKYDKILINQETKEIYLDLGKYNKEIQSGFSRGTMDQLFLALRLGVIKHYENDIKMPLLLDEFFSNWDHERLIAFIEILKIIQRERQVMITTCKKNVVETFRNLMDIHLIQMEGVDNE